MVMVAVPFLVASKLLVALTVMVVAVSLAPTRKMPSCPILDAVAAEIDQVTDASANPVFATTACMAMEVPFTTVAVAGVTVTLVMPLVAVVNATQLWNGDALKILDTWYG